MPRYDVHTHLGLDLGFYVHGWWPYALTAQDLLTNMQRFGFDRAICFPFTLPSAFDPYAFSKDELKLLPGRVPFDRENDLLAWEVSQLAPDGQLLQFAMFDPAREVQAQLKNLEKLIGRIKGLKTQSTTLQSNVRALLDESADLMHFAEQHDLPMLFHTAISPTDHWAQVADCTAIAEKFPRVRFNLAHNLRMDAIHLKRIAELPNVWVDCSAHLAHCFLAVKNSKIIAPLERRVDADFTKPTDVFQAVFNLIGNHYMWGSDAPYMSWCADTLRLIFSYQQESEVFLALPETIQRSMCETAPEAWLFGSKRK
jgi:predicted TIM-barrel fold metal-dependent hydrolase